MNKFEVIRTRYTVPCYAELR